MIYWWIWCKINMYQYIYLQGDLIMSVLGIVIVVIGVLAVVLGICSYCFYKESGWVHISAQIVGEYSYTERTMPTEARAILLHILRRVYSTTLTEMFTKKQYSLMKKRK